MSGILNEVKKIPPITRFLCASSVAVTVPAILNLVSSYNMAFFKDFVTNQWELWRLYTTFFYGGGGLSYIFNFAMLYRNSYELEWHYFVRSADYAWQLFIASIAVLCLNLPLRSVFHSRPLLVMITYVYSRLTPPGSQMSLMGLFTFPVVYFPYALVAMDLLTQGPGYAASSLTGIIAGHLWWWGVWDTRSLEAFGRSPGWLKRLIGDSTPRMPPESGVSVVVPRARRQDQQGGIGYNWGSGHRLGSS